MSSFALTPNGCSALELLDRATTDTSGILLDSDGNDSLLPVVVYDEEYASSAETEGEMRVRSRPQNPQRSGQILVIADNQTDFHARQQTLQQTIEQARRDGGTITYTPGGGTTVTFDLESIAINEVPYDGRMFAAFVSRWQFTYQCKPYGRLADVPIVSGATFSVPVASIELPGIPGSVPALGKLVITDLAGQTRDLLEWGLDTSYDPASPTPVLLGTSSLVTSGYSGTSASRSGSYSTNVLRATLATQATAICGTGRQTHTGRRRIRSRVYGAGTGPIYVRLGWWLGEPGEAQPGETPTGWVQLPAVGGFYDLDLGMIDIPADQVWCGQIEAFSATPGDTLDADLVEVIPATRYGKARVPSTPASAIALLAYDTFLQTSGALAGKTLPAGGTWSGAGDTDDYTIDTTGHTAQRTAVSDSAPRFALAGTGTASAIYVQADVTCDTSLSSSPARTGVLARYVDANNYLFAAAVWRHLTVADLGTFIGYVAIGKVVGGVETIIATASLGGRGFDAGATITVGVTANADGTWALAAATAGSPLGAPLLSGSDAAFATGGTLASGKFGLYDYAVSSTAETRKYDNFQAGVPPVNEHVINASKAMRVLSDAAERQPAGSGTVWRREPRYSGGYLIVPPAGVADATHRIAVKARRLDEALTDNGLTDQFKVDVTVTPRVALL